MHRLFAKSLAVALLILQFTANSFAQSNVTLRVMAANLNGSIQNYQPFAIRIFQGLKPDVVCIQEFNYTSTNGLGANTAAAFREMVDTAFGTNFAYYREGYTGIPNGIISRYPIVASGSWDDGDNAISDRGFAWAQIDLPGTNDLYAVSIHLKASTGGTEPTRRAAQVAVLKSLIQSNFPANAWVVVGGDCNTYSQAEACMTTLTTFVSDDPVPTDQTGDADTNNGRAQRYDRVMESFTLTNRQIPSVIGANIFSNGLVFDSRNYTPLADVTPVLSTDSGTPQHMAVIKDFQILTANTATVPPPVLTWEMPNFLRWIGVAGASYTVQSKTNFADNWLTRGNISGNGTNFSFTNGNNGASQQFFRVTSP